MKRELVLLSIVFLISCTLPLVSSTIVVEEDFDNVYNIGDTLELGFSIQRQSETGGYVNVFINCDDERKPVFTKYINIEAEEKKNFSYSFPASREGDCVVEVELNKDLNGDIIDKGSSKEFEISDEIDLSYNINNVVFSPGDKIEINGTAIKENREPLDGYVQGISGNLFNKTISVEDGEFSFSHVVEKERLPGNYSIKFHAYEKNSDEEIINKGRKETSIKIMPVPYSINIKSNKSVKPPAKIPIELEVFDQGNNTMANKSVLVKISNKQGDIVFEKTYKSGSSFNYSFASDAGQGFWHVRAYHGDIFSEESVYIAKNKQLEEMIQGEKLIVRNAGNVHYTGIYDINLSNSTYNKTLHESIELDIGESKTFDIGNELGKQGTFNVSAGGETFRVSFTGAAVSANIDPQSYVPALIILAVFIGGFFIYKKRKTISGFVKKQAGKLKEEKPKDKPKDKKKSKEKKKKKQKQEDELVPVEEIYQEKESEEKQGQEEERPRKNIHMTFFDISEVEDQVNLSRMAKKNGFSVKEMKEGVYFILHYSKDDKRTDEKLVELARQVRLKAKKMNKDVSVAINSGEFVNKASFLKDFSLETRKMLGQVEKGILVSENVYKKMGLVSRQSSTMKSKEGVINVYKIN